MRPDVGGFQPQFGAGRAVEGDGDVGGAQDAFHDDSDVEASELAGSLAIPMAGRAESLNVGVACAVVCFEAFRQRRGGGPGARSIEDGGKDRNDD